MATRDGSAKEIAAGGKGPSLKSESLKVGLQFASGLSQGAIDPGIKPFAETVAGIPGSSAELGSLMLSDMPNRIKNAALSGPNAFKIPEQETLHERTGFPVLPQPETGLGKALGLAANIAGNVAGFSVVASALKIKPLKLPSSAQVEDSIVKLESNIGEMTAGNNNIIKVGKSRATSDNILRNTAKAEQLEALELQKRTLADKAAVKIQTKEAMKASKKLGDEFGVEYEEAAAGKKILIDDYQAGLEETLMEAGILDDAGKLIQNVPISPSERKVLDLYGQVKTRKGGKVIHLDADVQEMDLITLDKNLKTVLVNNKQFGPGDHILSILRQKFSETVSGLRDVGRKFGQDFRDRNAVFAVFKPFSRKGTADVKQGIGVLENLASENPANVFPQNERIMSFMKKFTGSDPSDEVKSVGATIRNVNSQANLANTKATMTQAELNARLTAETGRNIQKGKEVKANLLNLKEIAVEREIANLERSRRIKDVSDTAKRVAGRVAGTAATAGAVFAGAKLGLKGGGANVNARSPT